MSLSIYQLSVPVFDRVMGNLAAILDKAAQHAIDHKIDPSVLLQARLFPDMFPLARQVQIVSDTAKGGASRLIGREPPSYEDKESSFEELKARLHKTSAFLETLTVGDFSGAEDREVTFRTRGQDVTRPGSVYLIHQVLPNLYFHATTAYAILRHNGVAVGKRDFLGAV